MYSGDKPRAKSFPTENYTFIINSKNYWNFSTGNSNAYGKKKCPNLREGQWIKIKKNLLYFSLLIKDYFYNSPDQC